jgi:soluble lytic murein transglycosylase-like protein/TolA-binding protein
VEGAGQQSRQMLSILLRILTAFAGLTSAGIPVAADNLRDSAQIPAALRQWAGTDTVSPTEALKAFRQGVDHYNNGRYDSALEAFPRDQDAKATAVGDYILLYRAKSNLDAMRNKEALDDFRLLENLYPDSPLIREALMGQCQALLELNDPKPVLAVLSRRKIEADSESLYYQARALDLAGEKDQAIAFYLQIYSRYPTSKHSPLAQRCLLLLSSEALKGTRNYGFRLQRAESLLRADDARDARALLLALGRVSAPDPRTFQKRSLLLAEAEYRLNRTSAALSQLRKVTAADPALHARAIYLEGACNRRLDREKNLLALRDKALKLYPLSSDTEELCLSAANFFVVNYESEKAREAFRVLFRAFPKGRYAETALWKLSVFSYFEKKYSEAALGFWNYLLAYPQPPSASSALYWMGRCYEKLGDYAKAKYVYRKAQELANDSYYGRRAREAETFLQKSGNGEIAPVPGLDFKRIAATCDGIRFSAILLPEPDEAGILIIERARQLVAADLTDFALSELSWGIRRSPQNDNALRYVMARIYASKEDHNGAISCLRRAFPDYNSRPIGSLPEEIWQLLFPVRHLEVISAQAAKTRTEPTLILGIIRQESGFEEEAHSRANARGLMQILPSTGQKLARQARVPRYNVGKLFHAETNIILGTRYLASLLQKYGRIELALAAYNAGSTRVDRWLKEFGNADAVEFVERIPYTETRNYIKQVLSNKAHYDLRVPSAPATR